MIVGFTGTRSQRLPPPQCNTVDQWLHSHMNEITEFHNGDCIGADAWATDCAYRYGIPIVIHPPSNYAIRNWFPAKLALRIEPEKPYLVRNHDIVDACDILLAMPAEMTMPNYSDIHYRSGTWSTWRYATQMHKHRMVIFPDGSGKIYPD